MAAQWTSIVLVAVDGYAAPVIDLDQPARNGPSPRRFAGARALFLIVVGALLAGGVLGGVLTYVWWYRPLAASVDRADSAVSVLVFAEPGDRAMSGEPGRVRMEAQVTVVNAGPETVNVLAVRVDQPGVTVRSPERERQLAPGTAVPVDVVVEWDCRAGGTAGLAASITVETVDEQARTISPVALDGTPWSDSRRAGCAGSG